MKSNRFAYVKYDAAATSASELFKSRFEEIEHMVASNLEPGREASLVLTKLEEAFMWVGKSLKNSVIKRNQQTPHLPERSND